MKTLSIFFAAVLVLSAVVPGFGYTSPYDEAFSQIDASGYSTLENALKSADIDMVYSAIKRIGELKITNARSIIREWLGQTNPETTRSNPALAARYRNIFNISIWTIGRIGENSDARLLANYWRAVSDVEGQVAIVNALGNLSNSEIALDALNRLTTTITDERIAFELVDAVVKHNSKKSVVPLMRMASPGRRVTGNVRAGSFSPEFRAYANKVANQISKEGKD
jgi:hypothetical protein